MSLNPACSSLAPAIGNRPSPVHFETVGGKFSVGTGHVAVTFGSSGGASGKVDTRPIAEMVGHLELPEIGPDLGKAIRDAARNYECDVRMGAGRLRSSS